MRMLKNRWEAETQDCSKLDVLQRLLDNGCRSICVHVASKRVHVAKLRGGTVELRIETGR